MIVICVAIVAALLGLRAYRRSEKPTGARNVRNRTTAQVEQWGVRIATSAGEHACPQVRKLLGSEFPMSEKPLLPLPECPYSHQCECHYIKLFDRRRQERRSGEERRQGGQRFEKDNPPRRTGNDRRKKIDWT